MGKVKITQVKSVIDHNKRQRLTMEALGLKRVSQSREHELTPQIEGMIKKVSHLIKVESI